MKTTSAEAAVRAALKTVFEAAMTAQSLTTEYVYFEEAPPERQGDTYAVFSVPTEATETTGQNAQHATMAPLVAWQGWSPNPVTLSALKTEVVERATATGAGRQPSLSVTGFTVLDVEVEQNTKALDESREAGRKTYFSHTLGLRVYVYQTATR